MDVDQLLVEGDRYKKNAKDALDRKVKGEEDLYIWQNQVEVLDTYLADTEDLADDHPEVAEKRTELRELKDELDQRLTAFLAEQEGEEVPPSPPAEVEAEDLALAGRELIIPEADAALDAEVNDVEEMDRWEEPLRILKSYLADSEPYEEHHPDLPKVREQAKARKRALEERIDNLVSSWREEDMAKGS